MTSFFTLSLPATLRFGRGMAAQAADDITALSANVLLVHGKSADRAAWLIVALNDSGCTVQTLACAKEPDIDMLRSALATLRGQGIGVVVMLGGGAVIDFGKAMAALLPAETDPMQHLEGEGDGQPLPTAPLPSVALPTTAGTGAEVTKNAVITLPQSGTKVSLRDPRMIPACAIVDPALTDGLPWAITLASGLDAITQVIEPFLSCKANRLTDALCRDAVPKGLSALITLKNTECPKARDDLAYCSMIGGIALANAGLGAVHGLAGVLGGRTGGPHGAICGALLPHVLRKNAQVLTLAKDTAKIDWVGGEIARALDVSADQAFARLADWAQEAGLQPLSQWGLTPADFAGVADRALSSSSMGGNPVPLSVDDLIEVLELEWNWGTKKGRAF